MSANVIGQRSQEIAVRMALGAQRGTTLWMVSRQGLSIVGAGLAIGLLFALGVGRLVGEFLVGHRTYRSSYLRYRVRLRSIIALAEC